MEVVRKKSHLQHYDQYELSRNEVITCIMIWCALIGFVTFSFYQSLILSILLMPCSIYMLKFERVRLITKRKVRMKLQFKDLLLSLLSSLAAGRSLENCFQVAQEDMSLLYPNVQDELMLELSIINHKLSNGEILEKCLIDLAERVNIPEFSQFVESLQTCKRSGGDLLTVMRRTANMLSDQIEIDNEISVIIAQKKMEARMMMAAPFIFLQFLNATAQDYMQSLYSGLGYALLTVVLCLLILCFWFMNKLTQIKL